jgi:hypothetical protein
MNPLYGGFFNCKVFINMKTDIDHIIYLMKRFTTGGKNGEIGEQDAATGSASSGGGTKPTYPTVTKWSSGRKFGPTHNPEQKVWTTGLTRGKANTLL